MMLYYYAYYKETALLSPSQIRHLIEPRPNDKNIYN